MSPANADTNAVPAAGASPRSPPAQPREHRQKPRVQAPPGEFTPATRPGEATATTRWLKTLASKARHAGAIAETVIWLGEIDASGHASLALALGGTCARAMETPWTSWHAVAATTPAPAALWWRTNAETTARIRRTFAQPGYAPARDVARALALGHPILAAIEPPERRWRIERDAPARAPRASVRVRAAALANAIRRCLHAVAPERSHHPAGWHGVAFGSAEGARTAWTAATNGRQLAACALALAHPARGDWGTIAGTNTEIVLPTRAARACARAIEHLSARQPEMIAYCDRTEDGLTITLGNDAIIRVTGVLGHFPAWRSTLALTEEHRGALRLDSEARRALCAAVRRARENDAARDPADPAQPARANTTTLACSAGAITVAPPDADAPARAIARTGDAGAATRAAAQGTTTKLRLPNDCLEQALASLASDEQPARASWSTPAEPLRIDHGPAILLIAPARV